MSMAIGILKYSVENTYYSICSSVLKLLYVLVGFAI